MQSCVQLPTPTPHSKPIASILPVPGAAAAEAALGFAAEAPSQVRPVLVDPTLGAEEDAAGEADPQPEPGASAVCPSIVSPNSLWDWTMVMGDG